MAFKLININTLRRFKDKLADIIAGKQDTLISGTNIKTVNNESLLGSGNINVGGLTSEPVSTTEAVPDFPFVEYVAQSLTDSQKAQARENIGAPGKVYVDDSPSGYSVSPNVRYNYGTLSGSLTFSLVAPTDQTIVNTYVWTFSSGSSAPTITWPSGITWFGGEPTINADKSYEVSIVDNKAIIAEF